MFCLVGEFFSVFIWVIGMLSVTLVPSDPSKLALCLTYKLKEVDPYIGSVQLGKHVTLKLVIIQYKHMVYIGVVCMRRGTFIVLGL